MNDTLTTAEPGPEDRGRQMEAIVSEHESALLRYAARIVVDPTAAQDVVQNVFIKLFRGWRAGTHPGTALKGWLFRVTHNEAVDHIRRESRLKLLHERQADERAGFVGLAAEGDDGRRERVLACVRQLAPLEQQILLLRLDQGLSYKEISEITGRSEGNVGKVLHYAVKKVTARVRGQDKAVAS